MCGRYHLLATPEQVKETFNLQRLPRFERSYNIAPGQKILTVVRLEDGSHKAVNLLWGLIPSWAKDKKISHHLINARSETLAEKPSFRSALKQRRCLIPATGFYEWQHQEEATYAHHICRPDHTLFAFAGLWEHCDLGEETIYSCTIITTAANALIQPIHQRMPVILKPENYNDWLNKQLPVAQAQQLLTQDAYEGIQLTPISDWVNNPQHDDERCLTLSKHC